MSQDDDSTRFLFAVDYDEEAERKRVEYLFNNWDDGEISSPNGLIQIAEDVDHEELYQELLTKVPEEQVSVHELTPTKTEVEPETRVVEKEIDASRDAVTTFLDYILSKKKAVVQSASRNEYELYSKKGRAELTYQLSETDGGISVRVRISGYPSAPSFLAEFFETELDDYAASQSTS
jgi:hypothetical protein